MSAAEYFKRADPSAWKYGPVSKSPGPTGGQSVWVNINGHNPRIQLALPTDPKLKCPFGLNRFDPEKTKDRETLAASVEDPHLLAFVEKIDELNIAQAILCKDKWFKGNPSDDDIRRMYCPLLKEDAKGEGYLPTIRLKANTQDDAANPLKVFRLSDDGKTYSKGTYDDLRAKHCEVLPIVAVYNIWFSKLQWGQTLLMTDVVIVQGKQLEEFEFDLGDAGAAPVSEEATRSKTPLPDPEEERVAKRKKIDVANSSDATQKQEITEESKTSVSVLLRE